MTALVHLTSEKNIALILRNGIKNGRGVYCMPVLPNYYVSHQWLRELKRTGQRVIMAIYFQVTPDERVLVGHYGRPHEDVALHQAVKAIMATPDARGYEIILPRSVGRREIIRARYVRQVIGWRFSPGAKGTRPCGCSYCAWGEARSRKRQEAYNTDEDRRPYAALLEELHVLAEDEVGRRDMSQEQSAAEHQRQIWQGIASTLDEIYWRRAGSATDLLFLLSYPHHSVAEALARALGRFRGASGRDMLLHLCQHPDEDVRETAGWSLLSRMGKDAMPYLEPLGADPTITAVIREYLDSSGRSFDAAAGGQDARAPRG